MKYGIGLVLLLLSISFISAYNVEVSPQNINITINAGEIQNLTTIVCQDYRDTQLINFSSNTLENLTITFLENPKSIIGCQNITIFANATHSNNYNYNKETQ